MAQRGTARGDRLYKQYQEQEARKARAKAQETPKERQAEAAKRKKRRTTTRRLVGTGKQAVEVRGEEAAAEERIRQAAAAQQQQQQQQGISIELDRSFQQPTDEEPQLQTSTPSPTEAIFTDKTFKPELGYSAGVISTALAIYSGAGLALRGLGALSLRGATAAAAGKTATTLGREAARKQGVKWTGKEWAGKVGWGKYLPVNPKTAKLTTSYLSKLVKASKNPTFVLGTIGATLGTYPWASWSEKEGIDGLVIGKRTALEAGDLDLADEIDVAMEDVANPNVWTQIWKAIPMANVLAANKVKLRGAIFNQRALDVVADNLRARQDAGMPLDETAYWAALAEEKKKAKAEERKEEEAYYSKLESDKLRRKAEERTADEEYFDRINEQNKKRKLKEREETEEYYDRINEQNKKRKLKEREETEEYYEGLKNK